MGDIDGLAVATFPVAQRGQREPLARHKLFLRQAQALALQLRIEVSMRPHREQHQRLGRQLVRLQPVGQQSLLLVELELVAEHAVQVAPFFFAKRGINGYGLDFGVQHGFVLGVQLFGHARKRGRGQDG